MKPTYEELQAENIALKAQVMEMATIIKQLQERISQLEARLNQNSKNSSKPPSSDQKANLPTPSKKEKRPYHPGASRNLLPEEMVTSREKRAVETCPRCQSLMRPTGKIFKWQQMEFPKIAPLVHQIELYTCQCSKCHLIARPELQEHEQFLLGPRFEALVNLCLSQFKQGHRPVRAFLAALIPDIHLSQGLVGKIKYRAARALSLPHEKLIQAILNTGASLHMDATGWRHQGINEHSIVMRVGNMIGFTFVKHQNGKTLADLLQGKTVNLVSDRGLATSQMRLRTHQYCLVHLLRNIQGLAENPATTLSQVQQLGEFHSSLLQLFADKHRLDRREISISTWKQYAYATWGDMKELVEEMLTDNPGKKLRRACKRILKDWRHFTVYLRSRDSPMTNNAAEESLRALVIARKLCFGSRSDYGRCWRAAIQSCVETLRRQGRSVLDFLAEAIQADRMGVPCPDIIR